MGVSLARLLSEKLGVLEGGGFRGLILAFGHPSLVYSELGKLELGDCLYVYWPGRGVDEARRLLRGCSMVYAGHIADRLGSEYRLVVIDSYEGLQANTLAAAGEMVKAGGVLLVAGDDWCSLSAPGSLGLFSEWLRMHALRAENVAVWREGVLEYEARWVRGPEKWLPGVRGAAAPVWLKRLACCDEQVLVARRAEELLKRYEAGVLLVTGDRGRGKSAAVGLALAYLVSKRLVGDVTVTGPSEESVQSLFRWLARGLKAAGVRFKAWGPGRKYHGVKGGWFRVRYLEPWRAEPAPLTVIEEAAAVGPARVRRLAGRSRNVIAVTTVHGYEGSGHYWLRVLKQQLPPTSIVELSVPVRYAPGDPLEKLLYDALLLRAPDPDSLPACKGSKSE